jgi:hypothetical protein
LLFLPFVPFFRVIARQNTLNSTATDGCTFGLGIACGDFHVSGSLAGAPELLVRGLYPGEKKPGSM